MRCPICEVEFSSPYLAKAAKSGESFWCPRGCKLSFVPAVTLELSTAEQVVALEDLFIKEAR